jgi:hypothetical protein
MLQLGEAGRKIDISEECEVLVAGGGIAGISAALAAARTGAKTLLVEKEWLPGGLATLGLVTIFLPLCDGRGRQVIYGIGEELLKLSIKYGIEEDFPVPSPWLKGGAPEEKQKTRYQVQYHPYTFALCAEKLLKEAGVKILYGTMACAALVENDRIRALFIENKSGRSAVSAETVVDTTGDADICKFAGEKTAQFGQGNVLAAWHYAFSEGSVNLKMAGFADAVKDSGDIKKSEDEGPVEDGVNVLSRRRFTGLEGRELSDMAEASHRALLDIIDRERVLHPGYYPVAMPVIPQIRMTRRICGVYTLDDKENGVHFEDSVGLTGDWRKPGPVYEIPYRTLYGREVKNLISAGRSISVTDQMWDISRVIPPCTVTGQAAGTAAALAVKKQKAAGTVDFSALPVKALQEKLAGDGVLVFLKDIKP